MKTLILIKLAFASVLVFAILSALDHRSLGLGIAALLGLATSAAALARRRLRPMELGVAATFAVCAGADALGIDLFGQPAAAVATPALLFVQAAIAAASCTFGRPWTAVYASADHGGLKRSPVFHAVNMALSALWAALFAGLGLIALLHLGALPMALVTGTGLVLSLFGPRLLVRWTLARAVRAREHNHWPTPRFSATPHGPDSCDIAVIGAGLGGLTVAALLADTGLKVIVAEQHTVPGGFAHHWLRKARHDGVPRVFRFDSGVHDVSGAQPGGAVHGILSRLGITLDWLRPPRSVDIDGEALPVPDDWRDYAALLAQRFPDSAEGIERFFATVRTIFDALYSLGRDHAGVPVAPANAEAMLAFAQAHPETVGWMDRPFLDLVSAHVGEPGAQRALLDLSGYVTDRAETLTVADMVPLYGYYFHGGFYPRGGSGALGQACADAVTRRGGTVLLKSPVAEILVENGRAAGMRLASGRTIRAAAVISNADPKRTLLDLVPRGALPSAVRERAEAVEPAASAFMVHLGLVGQPRIAPLSHAVLDDGRRIAVVSPSLVDPTAAPDGYGTLELTVLLPHREALDWTDGAEPGGEAAIRRGAAYAARKAALGDRMIAAAARLIPDLESRIVIRHDASPLTFARYGWSSDGAIYGVARKDRVKGLKSPVPGLYLAGAGTIGPGVEAVMIAGARVAEAIRPGVLQGSETPQRQSLVSSRIQFRKAASGG